jgi:hypothetical protein
MVSCKGVVLQYPQDSKLDGTQKLCILAVEEISSCTCWLSNPSLAVHGMHPVVCHDVANGAAYTTKINRY